MTLYRIQFLSETDDANDYEITVVRNDAGWRAALWSHPDSPSKKAKLVEVCAERGSETPNTTLEQLRRAASTACASNVAARFFVDDALAAVTNGKRK